MLNIKILVFAVVLIIGIGILLKKTGKWSKRFREYMYEQSHEMYGTGMAWKNTFGVFLSKAMVVFFGLMFILLIYILLFS